MPELVLVLLLIFCSIFSNLAADSSHLVKNLPGQPIVRFKQYAGQITIDSDRDRALFYWFYEADHSNYSSLPLAVWFNGGPGCSSVGNGALAELGPFSTNDAGTGLVINKYSWTKAANIVFLESPIGVGFSYSGTATDYDHFRDDEIANDALKFLILWFEKFPEYRQNDFYLIGESYAGHYVPTLARQILLYNSKHKDFFPFNRKHKHKHHKIKLKGIGLGNPWTDAYYDNLGTTHFYHSHSLISDETYEGLLKNCNFANDLPIDASDNDNKCKRALNQADIDMEKINMYDVYIQSCNSASNSTLRTRKAFNLVAAYNPCIDSVDPYLNDLSVQAALNIKKPMNWSSCNDIVYQNYRRTDIVASMLPIYKLLIKSKLRIWIYSGDVDGVVATPATRSWIKQLNLTIEQPWYAWSYKDQVGGWTQIYKGLTFASVRGAGHIGAGHMVPSTKPGQAFKPFETFLAGSRSCTP